MRPRFVFLIIVIASLCLAAVIGIGAMVMGDYFGDVAWKLIATMLSIALFSLTSLGATFALRRGFWMFVAVATYALSALGVAEYLFMCWLGELVFGDGPARWLVEFLVKSMGLIAAWAVALPLAGLLALSWFGNWLRVIRFIAILLPVALAATISGAVLLEMHGGESAWLRVIGVLAILTALHAIVLPILHRLFGGKRDAETARQTMNIICPRCLLAQVVDIGRSRCARCKLWFEIKIEEPRCPHCRYQLFNLTRPVCPECGKPLSPDELPADAVPHPSPTTPPTAAPVQ